MVPQFNVRKDNNKYLIDFKISSIYEDENGWGHFYVYDNQIKEQVKKDDEFEDLERLARKLKEIKNLNL